MEDEEMIARKNSCATLVKLVKLFAYSGGICCWMDCIDEELLGRFSDWSEDREAVEEELGTSFDGSIS